MTKIMVVMMMMTMMMMIIVVPGLRETTSVLIIMTSLGEDGVNVISSVCRVLLAKTQQ